MKNPLACADFAFPLLEHDGVLQLIGLLGFDGVDVGLFEGRSHLQPSSEFRNPERSGKKLAGKLARHQLKPADIFLQTAPDFYVLAPNHPSPSKRKKARDLFGDVPVKVLNKQIGFSFSNSRWSRMVQLQ